MVQRVRRRNNYAFIDSQNLHKAIEEMGWKLDYRRYRKYLHDRYGIRRAYLFLGYLPSQQPLYASLQKKGYVLVFKPILKLADGLVKGNCDAELVLQAMIDLSTYDQALIVSGDGDFYCLVKHLYEKQKLLALMAPNRHKYSGLLKEAAREKLIFMNDLRVKLEYAAQLKKHRSRTKR